MLNEWCLRRSDAAEPRSEVIPRRAAVTRARTKVAVEVQVEAYKPPRGDVKKSMGELRSRNDNPFLNRMIEKQATREGANRCECI